VAAHPIGAVMIIVAGVALSWRLRNTPIVAAGALVGGIFGGLPGAVALVVSCSIDFTIVSCPISPMISVYV